MAGGMQLLAPRVAQGSRKCEGVHQCWASFSSLSQLVYSLTSLKLEEIFLTCLGFRSNNSQWQMVAICCHAQAFSGYKLQINFRTYHSSSPSCSYSWIKSFTRVVRFRTALPHCYSLLANFTYRSVEEHTALLAVFCGDRSYLVVFFPSGLLEAKLPHLDFLKACQHSREGFWILTIFWLHIKAYKNI